MEAMLSEFDLFQPPVMQNTIVSEYDDCINATNAINSGSVLNTLEFNVPGANDLYRDLNNSYLYLRCKLVAANGTNVADTLAVAPANLTLHTMFSNMSMTLCGKEITERDSLYPYRAYIETLLGYKKDVLDTRAVCEGWKKDDGSKMDAILLDANGQDGFKERHGMVKQSREFVLMGRPHLDLFHQPLDIPANCPFTLRLTPSPLAFTLMGAADTTSKIVLQDAKLYVRTKKVVPELILAHKGMLQKGHNMRFPMNRVTMSRYALSTGITSQNVTLSFPAKLPKRIVVGFVKNSSVTGAFDENPFNFKPFDVQKLHLNVNGLQLPASGLEMKFANKDYYRAYLNTLAALDMDTGNSAICITPKDFESGYTLFAFKIAPGPTDSTVHTAANSVGSMNLSVTFGTALAAPVDVIVFAETPSTLEIDSVNAVIIL
jgi:hypothetical protein